MSADLEFDCSRPRAVKLSVACDTPKQPPEPTGGQVAVSERLEKRKDDLTAVRHLSGRGGASPQKHDPPGNTAGVHKWTARIVRRKTDSQKNCDRQRNTVFDPDAQRRALDAVLATRQATCLILSQKPAIKPRMAPPASQL